MRPLDPVQDMPDILNLIEIGFQSELDPQGWKMLDQMRRIYSPGNVTQSIYQRTSDTVGFVWVQDARIVGNLSLRYALPRSSRGRLIGNVVVHPDYRGRGIGRALMERAIDTARDQGAHWIGLEVRASNAIAHRLYEHLGFRIAGCTQHLIRPAGLRWPDSPRPDSLWRRATAKDNAHWKQLATLAYSHDQRLVLEVRGEIYEFGSLERRLNLWFSRRDEKAWVHDDGNGRVTLAAHIEIEKRYKFHSWDMLMHPELGECAARELVARCLAGARRFPDWPVIAIVPDQDVLVDALQAIDFKPHRTLQQMTMELF